MAKTSKKALSDLDAAIDQLGGGASPIARPKRVRKAVSSRPAAKPKSRNKKR